MKSSKAKISAVFTVFYDLNGTSADDLAAMLGGGLDRLMGEGCLTGETPAEVEVSSHEVVVLGTGGKDAGACFRPDANESLALIDDIWNKANDNLHEGDFADLSRFLLVLCAAIASKEWVDIGPDSAPYADAALNFLEAHFPSDSAVWRFVQVS